MKNPLLFLLLLISTVNYAQNYYILSGSVRDSATNRPLVRAAIVINYERKITGTYTDDEGRFSIKLEAGRHVVVIRHVGYVSFRQGLNIYRDRTLDLRLPTIASQLEEVIVTSKGYDRNVRKPLLGVSQINIATLKRMPAALGEVRSTIFCFG